MFPDHHCTRPVVRWNLRLDFSLLPRRRLLGRYFDYCSEMLAVVSKIGALYVQNFADPVAVTAVDEIETLTAGLSRKIWQKIMILETQSGRNQD